MKKSKFTEQQIAFALHQAESGTSVVEVCGVARQSGWEASDNQDGNWDRGNSIVIAA